ncbi:hypothetical protein ACP275_06G154800 [Erythranthe tilingii]
MVVGSTAGMVEHMDMVKQRLQLGNIPYKGVWDCVKRVLREEGFFSKSNSSSREFFANPTRFIFSLTMILKFITQLHHEVGMFSQNAERFVSFPLYFVGK